MPLDSLKSSPMVLHTCGCNSETNAVAWMSGTRHWMLRLLASQEESFLKVKGWYGMDSRFFKPRWFADKLHWTTKELKRGLLEQGCLTRQDSEDPTKTLFCIECTWPAKVLLRQSNFKKTNKYDPLWLYSVTPLQDSCDSLRICCSTGLFGVCCHAPLIPEVRFSPCSNAELLTDDLSQSEDGPAEDSDGDDSSD